MCSSFLRVSISVVIVRVMVKAEKTAGSSAPKAAPSRVGGQQPSKCAACSLIKPNEKFRSGPDGARTLCSACFAAYKKHQSLQLFVSSSGKVSTKKFPGARRVLRYKFRELQHKLYSQRFLDPHIIEVAPEQAQSERKLCCKSEPPNATSVDKARDQLGCKRDPCSQELPKAKANAKESAGSTPGARECQKRPAELLDKQPERERATKKMKKNNSARPSREHSEQEHRPHVSSSPVVPEEATDPRKDVTRLRTPVKQAPLPSSTVDTTLLPLAVRPDVGCDTTPTVRADSLWPRSAYEESERNFMLARPGASAFNSEGSRVFYSVKATRRTSTGTAAEVHRFSVPGDVTFDLFETGIKGLFGLASRLKLAYLDDEGDDVIVTSSNELAEMFTLADRAALSPLRITVSAGRPRRILT